MHSSIDTARSMVEQLEKVDPSQLTHDEKLAFWINVHNALLMHVMISQPICESCKLRYFLCILLSYRYYSAMQAYLAYGIPRNNLKRMTLLQRVRNLMLCTCLFNLSNKIDNINSHS